MDLLVQSFKMDWPVLVPIIFAGILVLAVVMNRWSYYKKNKRNIEDFIKALQPELASGDMTGAQNLAIRCGGVIGEVTEEAVRILSEQKKTGFSRSFDIAAALGIRKLEKNLTILGTIGGVAPFLGLFGTVVRILYTFQDLAVQGNQSAAVANGIGSALVCTAVGLGVAIVAVIFYNSFQSVVKHFEDDFNLIKLLFLNFVDSDDVKVAKTSANPMI
ncbi:MotA/TolQ/ExbB proton channel family protein [bacterium]|nr:MotA/TolQ/ExbB proton channel family protein [bacterium]